MLFLVDVAIVCSLIGRTDGLGGECSKRLDGVEAGGDNKNRGTWVSVKVFAKEDLSESAPNKSGDFFFLPP